MMVNSIGSDGRRPGGKKAKTMLGELCKEQKTYVHGK